MHSQPSSSGLDQLRRWFQDALDTAPKDSARIPVADVFRHELQRQPSLSAQAIQRAISRLLRKGWGHLREDLSQQAIARVLDPKATVARHALIDLIARTDAGLVGWVHDFWHNRCRTVFRTMRRQAGRNATSPSEPEDVEGSGPGPLDLLIAEEHHSRIQAILERLPRTREQVELREAGRSLREIAQELKVDRTTLHRDLGRLAALIARQESRKSSE